MKATGMACLRTPGIGPGGWHPVDVDFLSVGRSLSLVTGNKVIEDTGCVGIPSSDCLVRHLLDDMG